MQEKFRGMPVEGKEPIFGYLVRDERAGKAYILPEIKYVSKGSQPFAIDGFVEVEPESVVRCTGYLDAQDKQICEGDCLIVLDGDNGDILYSFIVAFGPCGIRKNGGYIGFFVQAASDATSRCMEFRLRTDVLYWINEYTCVVNNRDVSRPSDAGADESEG